MSQAAILAEITRLDGPLAEVQADEVTVRMAADKWDCSPAAAQRRLDGLVEVGQLVRREALSVNKRYCWAYRLSE